MTTAPIVFDIEIKTSPSKTDPAIKKRLQMQSAEKTCAPPSLEDIEQRLQRAQDVRNNELARRGRTDQKVIEVRWRKSSMEDEQRKRLLVNLKKVDTAQEKRQLAIASKVELAKKHGAVASQLVLKRRNSELERKRIETQKRLDDADLLRQKTIQEKIEIAKKTNEKLLKVVAKKAETKKEVEEKLKISFLAKE